MANWNYIDFWNEALTQLKNEFEMTSRGTEFILWFKMTYVEARENVIVSNVPSSFYKDQIINRGYVSLIEKKLQELSGQLIKIEISASKMPVAQYVQKNDAVENQSKEKTEKPVEIIIPDIKVQNTNTSQKHPTLNESYTFERFVKGDNNNFACNVAYAVAKNPGREYNPLLIYGGVGLGKTHLMQAIGNLAWSESKKNNTKCNVIYTTAETYTNEFINSIHSDSSKSEPSKFKNKYRSADILLIDDIHFLQGKEGTQEELFHTFNSLYDSFKHIVFTCDRPVSELKNLTERLRSRFTRGISIDLQPPKYETRRAILEKKLQDQQISISAEIIDLIAENVETNVRDLEACLQTVTAYKELIGTDVTVDKAKDLLRTYFCSQNTSNIGVDLIQKTVADHYNLTLADLKGKKRTRNVTLPRQLAMFICRELTEYSTTELGAEFGGRDHTTVMHSCQKIEESIRSDSMLEQTIQSLIRKIKETKK